MRDDHERFLRAGGQVALVGMGSVEQTAAFQQSQRLPFRCLADPEKIAYRAYGLRQGTLGQIAGPRMWLRGLKAALRGGVGIPVGDVWQMPGTFIIDREGMIRFAHYSTSTVEWPSNNELIGVLKSLATYEDVSLG